MMTTIPSTAPRRGKESVRTERSNGARHDPADHVSAKAEAWFDSLSAAQTKAVLRALAGT